MEVVRADKEQSAVFVAKKVNSALKQGSVFLLLSGGSNILLACSIRQKLELNNRLTISLTDERFGVPGHKESNWEQLKLAGFNFEELNLLPVLNGLNIEETTKEYIRNLENGARDSQTTIGLFGMGADGHTSGILPGSLAVDAKDIASSYQGPDYLRVTTTPAFFNCLDTAFLAARGENKLEQLKTLVNSKIGVGNQPVQALKQAHELIVLCDQTIEKDSS